MRVDCIIQFCPPDDAHMCSKHVEFWNKVIIKFNSSSCWILINKYIEMHGQQNTKKKKEKGLLDVSCDIQFSVVIHDVT